MGWFGQRPAALGGHGETTVGAKDPRPARAAARAGRPPAPGVAAKLCATKRITDALVERRILTVDRDNFDLAPRGVAWLDTLGIDADVLRQRRRSVARACLDWTERRPHLGGSAGAALATALFTQRSISRLPGSRAVRITPAGARWLEHELGITTLS